MTVRALEKRLELGAMEQRHLKSQLDAMNRKINRLKSLIPFGSRLSSSGVDLLDRRRGEEMSAIAGLLRFDGQPAGLADGSGMMEAMERYDADDVRTWTDGPYFSAAGPNGSRPSPYNERLPYYDPTYRLAIAADAIIDNRRELFDLLQVRPADRAGMTDSELILLAYRKWGREAPEHLVGDFAFVIWDEQERLLFGARDLFG